MSEELLEVVTGAEPTFAVIWLHGLGADGSDFVEAVPELGLADSASGRFIFPNAPHRPVSCNGGYVMRAWYDIFSLEPSHRRVDRSGLLASCAEVRGLIGREMARGIPAHRIFIAGFSQGGAVAYTAALSHDQPLGGVIALSTYLPVPDILEDVAQRVNRDLPIFAAHGTADDVVSLQLGVAARDFLQERGCRLAWHTYAMSHSVCLEELRAIGSWLQARLQDEPVPAPPR